MNTEDLTKHEHLQQFLLQDGWTSGTSLGSNIWWKRWPNAPACRHNDTKPGIQLIVTRHRIVLPLEDHLSYTLSIRGEKPDGVWVELQVYGLDAETLERELNAQCEQLLAAWGTMVQMSKPT